MWVVSSICCRLATVITVPVYGPILVPCLIQAVENTPSCLPGISDVSILIWSGSVADKASNLESVGSVSETKKINTENGYTSSLV